MNLISCSKRSNFLFRAGQKPLKYRKVRAFSFRLRYKRKEIDIVKLCSEREAGRFDPQPGGVAGWDPMEGRCQALPPRLRLAVVVGSQPVQFML